MCTNESQVLHLPMGEIDTDSPDYKPPKDFVQSMASAGQVTPIIVIEKDDRWELWDGRARYAAAAELGWGSIKAIIANNTIDAENKKAAVTLASNVRGANIVSEIRAIEALLQDDDGLEIIQRMGGLTKGQIAAKQRLGRLAPEFLAMLENGELGKSAAKYLAKTGDHDSQRRAWELAKAEAAKSKRGLVTVTMVDNASRQVRQENQPALPAPPPIAVQASQRSNGFDAVVLATGLRHVLDSQEWTPTEWKTLTDAANILEMAG